MQFSWKACRWIECQSELTGWHIHQTLYGHGGERCMVLARTKESWSTGMTLRHEPSINSMDVSGMVILAWDLAMTSTKSP